MRTPRLMVRGLLTDQRVECRTRANRNSMYTMSHWWKKDLGPAGSKLFFHRKRKLTRPRKADSFRLGISLSDSFSISRHVAWNLTTAKEVEEVEEQSWQLNASCKDEIHFCYIFRLFKIKWVYALFFFFSKRIKIRSSITISINFCFIYIYI